MEGRENFAFVYVLTSLADSLTCTERGNAEDFYYYDKSEGVRTSGQAFSDKTKYVETSPNSRASPRGDSLSIWILNARPKSPSIKQTSGGLRICKQSGLLSSLFLLSVSSLFVITCFED